MFYNIHLFCSSLVLLLSVIVRINGQLQQPIGCFVCNSMNGEDYCLDPPDLNKISSISCFMGYVCSKVLFSYGMQKVAVRDCVRSHYEACSETETPIRSIMTDFLCTTCSTEKCNSSTTNKAIRFCVVLFVLCPKLLI